MLKPFASSSRGNVYEVYDGHSRVLLECGKKGSALRKLLGRPLTDYAACLISHEHMDHAAGAKDLARLGVPVWASAGTMDALHLDGALNTNRILDGRVLDIAGYRVRPFPVVHDAAQPLGFLVQSVATGERLVFATDTAYLRYTFEDVDEIAVECNYCLESLESSELHQSVRERIIRSHFEIGRVMEWLGKCDLAKTRRIWLIHLSAAHADAGRFVEIIREATGIETLIAEG